MTSLTRGPLPASVYWRRRLVVLGVPVALVVVLAQVLGSGSDGSEPEPERGAAAVVVAEVDESATEVADTEATEPADGASASSGATPASEGRRGGGKGGRRGGKVEPVLADPQGRCDGADVAVTPEVESAVAGRDVTVSLGLMTVESPACTWKVSPHNLSLKITSGSDFIWSSQHCPRAVPRQEVVVRNNATTTVEVVWADAKRSDADCSPITEWALPGWYHVSAAALGGEPSEDKFELETPAAETITRTAKPRKQR